VVNAADVYDELDETMMYASQQATAEVYDEVNETMMYSEVDQSTSSGNVSKQATSEYHDIDVSVTSNSDYAAVDNAVNAPSFRFRHANNTTVCIWFGFIRLLY
jgi:hypothetical protein